MGDVFTLSIYLKVVSKKVAYFTFKENYQHHIYLSRYRQISINKNVAK